MVSYEYRTANSRTVIGASFILAFLAAPAFGEANGNKFYPDDPLLREPAPHAVKQLAKRHVNDIYDFLENSFVTPRKEGKESRQGPHPALDPNTLGDVPDSAWYTNRHYSRRMSIEELKRGPGDSTPPSPHAAWRVISAKSDGITPGVAIEDEHKNRYLLKLDPPRYPELPSAADVIGSKAFYALGYYTPENYIVHFRREALQVPEGVMWHDSIGKEHPLTPLILDGMLKGQPKGPDGTYRALASRWIAGEVVGPFSYEGMRTDDPNDIVPHQDRRVLRGLRVFAAWLNHHDTRSINSMDSLVEENGVSYVKHYLLDFGSILGSAAYRPKYPWFGNQYILGNKEAVLQVVTFGFCPPRWARADYPKLTGVGLFDSWSFDPLSWKSNYPNPAFLLMDREDAFWAAKQVAAFTDEEIRALVDTGEYSDPRAAEWIADSLAKRRDKIAEAWFSRVLPLDKFSVVGSKLTWEDLGARYDFAKRREYSVRWASSDENGRLTPLPNATGREVPALQSSSPYLAAVIECAHSGTACGRAITVYLRECQTRVEVVGIDR